MPESHSRVEGDEPLHLLADGSFAAFGSNRYELAQLDDETWWKRRAPEAILSGLKRLRGNLEHG